MKHVTVGVQVCLIAMLFVLSDSRLAIAQEGPTEFEFFGGTTMNLEGSRAFVAVASGRNFLTADSGEHKVLPSIGFAISRFPGKVLGGYADFSFVDGGSASASIGSNASEVKSYLLDFHGGLQVQYPGRVRPYANFGSGLAHSSTKIALTQFGFTDKENDGQWRGSLIYGGGVRFGLTDQVGMRVALEGVAAYPLGSDSTIETNYYGRFLVGVYFSN